MSAENDVQSATVQDLAREVQQLRAELETERRRQEQLERALADADRKLQSLRRNAVTRSTINHFADALVDADIADYTADPLTYRGEFESFGDRLDDLDDVVGDHESFLDEWGAGTTSSRDEAWYQVVQAARNLHGTPDHTTNDGRHVVLYADNLDQALSYTYRYCVDLVETWGGEKEGVTWKPHVPATAGNDNEEKRKRLILDMDVWGSDE